MRHTNKSRKSVKSVSNLQSTSNGYYIVPKMKVIKVEGNSSRDIQIPLICVSNSVKTVKSSVQVLLVYTLGT